MVITGASVYTEEGRFENKDIYICGQYFSKEDTGEERVIDAAGCYAVPGFTDIHFHGCGGRDFCEGKTEAIETMAAYQASVGVTSIVPATMTMDEEVLYRACEAAADYRKRQEAGAFKTGAALCGIYMEGPFISKEKMGAQNPKFIQMPNQSLLDNMQIKSEGMVKLAAIAPEVSGAMEFIERNKGKIILSVAHTTADYDTARCAFEKGADQVTHLYNAMPAFSHRAPGVIGAAADAEAWAELICDGVHVHPSAVRAAFKLFSQERIIFVSDSMMATGLLDGNYSLGGQPVRVTGNLAVLKDKTIAGSVTNLADCVRKAVLDMDIPLETAIRCAAVNPAKRIGCYDRYGSIRPGKVANLVLLDKKKLHTRSVFLRGKQLKNPSLSCTIGKG